MDAKEKELLEDIANAIIDDDKSNDDSKIMAGAVLGLLKQMEGKVLVPEDFMERLYAWFEGDGDTVSFGMAMGEDLVKLMEP